MFFCNFKATIKIYCQFLYYEGIFYLSAGSHNGSYFVSFSYMRCQTKEIFGTHYHGVVTFQPHLSNLKSKFKIKESRVLNGQITIFQVGVH